MNVPQLRFKNDDGNEFPEWKETTLGKVASQGIKWSLTGGPFGSNLKAEDYTVDGVRIIQLQNIGDGIFNGDYKIYTSINKADELLSCNIYPNEIIISKMGDPVARCCIIPNDAERYLMASDGIRLVVDFNKFNNKFIHDSINHQTFRRKALEVSTGSTRKRIGLSELKMLPIRHPCLKEQTKIANFLTAVDERITQLTQKDVLLNQYKKGVMQKIFSQELRFKDDDGSEFPEWEEVKISDIASLKNGYAFKSSTYSVEGKYKVLTIANVQDGCISLTSCNKVEEIPLDIANHQILNLGEILISMTGNVGRVAILNEENCLLNQRVGKFEIKNNTANKSFVYQVLLQDKFKTSMDSISQGGAQKNIGVSDISDYSFNLPCIQEQTKIANFLTAIDDKITATQSQLELVKQYKQGLLQQMFV